MGPIGTRVAIAAVMMAATGFNVADRLRRLAGQPPAVHRAVRAYEQRPRHGA